MLSILLLNLADCPLWRSVRLGEKWTSADRPLRSANMVSTLYESLFI
jgi:hypothetical protein